MKRTFQNRKTIFIFMTLLLSICLMACRGNTKDKPNSDDQAAIKIFYLDTSQTSIVGMDYLPTSDNKNDLIKELIGVISQNPKSSSMKKAKPDSIVIQDYHLMEDGRLTLDFNSEYLNFTGVAEILSRATIVKTLSQIDGVDYVDFTINGQPLMDSFDKPVGLMKESDFINSIYAENVLVTIYFSNEEGTRLVPSNLRITYDGNITIAELIVNRLILGPIEEGMLSTMPKGTKINSITVKEGMCYVDFNEEFLNKNTDVDSELIIYSVVNSLVELSYVNRVQFTINGAMVEEYKGIPFSGPFERKLELLDESR